MSREAEPGAPAAIHPPHSIRGLSSSDKGRANWRQTRSIIVATPIPPPIHIVISAADLFWRSSSSSTVPISIPPESEM